MTSLVAPVWPEDEYVVFGSGAFVRASLSPCADCGNHMFQIVQRDNGSRWAECEKCTQKRGRNGRLVGWLDLVRGVAIPV